MSLTKQPTSANEQTIEDNAIAAEKFRAEIERLERTCKRDPDTGKYVLSHQDVKDLIDFNAKVEREVGCSFIDFRSMYLACAKEVRDAREKENPVPQSKAIENGRQSE